MAKYRKVYEADFQPILNAMELFGSASIRNPKTAYKAISSVLPAMLDLFKLIESRPVLEDDE